VSSQGLWAFALDLYARPGVEALLLDLQDKHGQCVAYLIWALWLAAEGRRADNGALAEAAGLARAWETVATGPLRTLRRSLANNPAAAPKSVREWLRAQVQAVELDAERRLLEMLEAASPAAGPAALDPARTLAGAAKAWGGAPPPALLASLAAAA
jgi:uncharacterized protein (TIGR02444 family)